MTGWSGGGAPRAGSLNDTKSSEAVVIAVAVIAVIIVSFSGCTQKTVFSSKHT